MKNIKTYMCMLLFIAVLVIVMAGCKLAMKSEPVTTEAPVDTTEPVVTMDLTEAPEVTATPTTKPVATTKPTETPAPTEKPVETTKPITTPTPTATPVTTPKPSEKPAETPKPQPTPAPTPKPECQHDWKVHYKTVHHDAEYKTDHHDAEYKTVQHDAEGYWTEAWDNVVGTGTYVKVCNTCGYSTSSFDAILAHCDPFVNPEHASYHEEEVETTIHYDAEWVETKPAWDEQVLVKEAYDEQVLVKAAWDEQVVDYYTCSKCGARKNQ